MPAAAAGHETASSSSPGSSAPSNVTSTARRRSVRRPRTSMSSLDDSGDDMLQFRIGRGLVAEQVRKQDWILQLEQRFKPAPFDFGGVRVPPFQVALQQFIQLAHAAPASPAQSR